MPNIHPVSRERHANKRWLRSPDFRFASKEVVIPLSAQEMPQAVMALPIAFLANKDMFMPVALMGLNPGKNLFVAQDGRWLSGFVPAPYKGYPFLLGNSEDGKQLLCINEEASLLTETAGEPFFGDDDQPTPVVSEVLKFLSQIAASRGTAQRICSVLKQYELIQPWPIILKNEKGEQNVEGLFRIDEAKLNSLPTDAFLALRDAGALQLAYCQLLSMQHLTMLGQLAEAHAKADAQAATKLPTKGKDLDLSFLSEGELFKF